VVLQASACQTRPVILKVHISSWELEEDRWVLRLGDEVGFWMFLREADPSTATREDMQEIRGHARPAPWDEVEVEVGRHPVRVDVGPAALYWEAPEPVSGEVQVVGAIRRDAVDAPPGFPDTRAVVRRIRMEWTPYARLSSGEWAPDAAERPHYVDVAKSFFPAGRDSEPPRSALDRARAMARRVASNLRPSHYSQMVVMDASDQDDASGTTDLEWTGVLLDLEVLGTATT
jgi:hypothetical protein